MASQLITITAKTWTQLPTATKFLAQNNGQHVIKVQANNTEPALDPIFGHDLQPRLSMSNLSTETHWVYCDQPINLVFTINDL